jgi:hypothetical protein
MTITFWLVELRPAFDGHPPFPPTYYGGYRFDPLNEAKTTDPNRAARFMYKYDADVVAMKLLPTKSCIWKATEHVFLDQDAFTYAEPEDMPQA